MKIKCRLNVLFELKAYSVHLTGTYIDCSLSASVEFNANTACKEKEADLKSASVKLKVKLLSVNLSHVLDEHENFVTVTPLVVVPGNKLYERICKSDTCFSIED